MRYVRKGLRQYEFARNVGISPNFLSDIDRDKKIPSEPVWLSIEYRYEVNKDWLLTGEGPMMKKEG